MTVKMIPLTLLLVVAGSSHSQTQESYKHNEWWGPRGTSDSAATAEAYGTGDAAGATAETPSAIITSSADEGVGQGLPYSTPGAMLGDQEQGPPSSGSAATSGDGMYVPTPLLGQGYPSYAVGAAEAYGRPYQSSVGDEAAASGTVSVGVPPEGQNHEHEYSELVSSATTSSTAAVASEGSRTGLYMVKENPRYFSVGDRSSAAGINYIYEAPYFEHGSVADPSTGTAAVDISEGSYQVEQRPEYPSGASGGGPYVRYDYPVNRAVYLLSQYPVHGSASVPASTTRTGETYVVPYLARRYTGYGGASTADPRGGTYYLPYWGR